MLRGAGAAARRIEAHVFAAERLHGDDTTVPVLAKGKTDHRAMLGLRARRSAVRRPGTAGGDVLLLARSRRRTSRRHLAGYAGILQADAYGGYNKLYEADRKPGPIIEAALLGACPPAILRPGRYRRQCPPQGQGKTAGVISPLALEAVRRIDALFEIERSINGQSAERRRQVRQELSAPLIADLERWLREQRPKLSRGNDLAKAMDYMLKRWPAFTRFLDDGRICLTNNAAERALRGIASAENRGCSPVPTAAASAPPPCTA